MGIWIKWDEVVNGYYHEVSQCNQCGWTTDALHREEMHYCPNCGCAMEEEKEATNE